MRLVAIMLGALTVLTACATPTPYQPAVGSRWGYEEMQIERNRFRVSFGGNSLTDRETVENYLLYRAAELTVQQGYDHFILVNRATDEDSRVVGMRRDPFFRGSRLGMRYAYYHPRWGWRSMYDPFWDDVNYREINRYEASAEIVFGRGPKPANDPGAFNAREVIRNLGENIVRPATD